jgi:hypothetical protein
MRMPIASLACCALLMPLAPTPAEATASTTSTVLNTCYKTKYGITLKVRIRDYGSYARVRVSHPDGRGAFREHRVGYVLGGAEFYPDGTTASTRPKPRIMNPSTRVHTNGSGSVEAFVWFHLINGKTVRLFCSMHES